MRANPLADVRVPFLDLRRAHSTLRDALLEDFGRLVDSGAFTNGPDVAAFERAFAAYCGTSQCIGVASGLDALRLGLLAAGIEDGDEVIVPANTFIATYEAVTQAGGRPVVVDVTESDYNIDVAQTEAAVGPRTRFIIPVHLYGQMADVRQLLSVAARHGLRVIEDACQAHGASRDGFNAGASGAGAAFSFYPGKNLGAFGDAGALVTSDDSVASTVRALREHGQRSKYRHDFLGYTARLDTIQAIVLLHKLPQLDAWNDQRRRAAAFYTEALSGLGDLKLPPVPRGSRPVWHLYVVRTVERGRLLEFLRRRGIDAGLHYPEPPHLARSYSFLAHRRGDFPVAERIADEVLSLPLFPGITDAQLEAVVDAVGAFFRRG